MAQPRGTVTFLFTDIEGSTARWERFPAAMSVALKVHDALVRDAIEAVGGFVFKVVGDAFCTAFATPDAAIGAALAAQRALASQAFADVGGLRVRMALHAGVPEVGDGDYYGPVVNRVARLLSTAWGGQIVLSEIVRSLAGALPGVRYRDLGEHRLKDLGDVEHVHQLEAGGLAAEFPPLLSVGGESGNLPATRSTLVGRDGSIEAIVRQLERARLVTIAGTGGVGKTQTALAAGHRVAATFPDGVWFVELASLRDGAPVETAVASAVGVEQSATEALDATLPRYFKRRHALLVMDNCEHVIERAAAFVDTVLDAAPQVRVVATSREPLELDGESVCILEPLRASETGDDVAAIAASDAVRLFVQRATAVRPDFALDASNAATIARICRRLDGVPLALELAAARVASLSLDELEARLEDRFGVLVGGKRSAAPRQRSLHALIAWSHDMLDEDERRLFRRLSVFVNGWRLDAAETVCGDDDARVTIERTTASLVAKSLVVADVRGAAGRYRFLETVRDFACERLRESGEWDDVHDRHARWVRAFTAIVELGVPLPEAASHARAMEGDNIRAALLWTLVDGHDDVLGAEIVADVVTFWSSAHSMQPDARVWVARALAIEGRSSALVCAKLWQAASMLGNGRRTVDAARKSLAYAEAASSALLVAEAHKWLAYGLWQVGDLIAARSAIDEALRRHELAGSPVSLVADALNTKANVALNAGDLIGARTFFEQALRGFRTANDGARAARVNGDLAEVDYAAGDAARALTRIDESIAVFRRLGELQLESTAHANAAAYLAALDDDRAAAARADVALRLARKIGDPQIVAVALQRRGAIAARRGDDERAARLIGYVDAWYESEGYAREWSEARERASAFATLESRRSAASLAALLQVGRQMSELEAVSL